MMARVGLVVVLLGGAAAHQRDYSGHQVLRLEGLDPAAVGFLGAHGDFWEPPPGNGSGGASLCVGRGPGRRVRAFLRRRGLPFQVWIEDVQAVIQRERQQNLPTGRAVSRRVGLWEVLVAGDGGREGRGGRGLARLPGMDWAHYHRLPTILAWMDQLAARHPATVSLQVIGHSGEGRPLVVVRVGSGRPGRPAVFVEGGIHAREWISPAAVTFMVDQLVTQPANRDLLDYYDFYFLPVTNPDGYEYSHTTDRMWRKNRSQSSSLLNVLSNCRGTDLNRNFGHRWGEGFDPLDLQAKAGTPLPCMPTFQGDAAFSEPESSAVRRFVLARRGAIVAYLAYHSFGEKILYPWSHTKEKVADWEALHHMANSMAEAAYRESRGRDYYRIGTAAELQYAAVGGSDDWARGAAGIRWVYLLELPGRGHGFLLPPGHIKQVGRSSLAGLRGLLTAVANTLE